MLWLFDCQRTFVHDVVNIKIVHDVMNVIKYAIASSACRPYPPFASWVKLGFCLKSVRRFQIPFPSYSVYGINIALPMKENPLYAGSPPSKPKRMLFQINSYFEFTPENGPNVPPTSCTPFVMVISSRHFWYPIKASRYNSLNLSSVIFVIKIGRA